MKATGGRGDVGSFLGAIRYADFFVLLDCLECEIGLSNKPRGTYPPWVIRCASRATHALFPKAYFITLEKARRAYSLGIAAGMVRAGQLVAAAALSGYHDELPEPTEAQCALAWKLLYGEDASSLTRPTDGDLVPAEVSKWVSETEAGFGLTDSADYHQGVADAVRMLTGENEITEATNIYAFMAIFWHLVEQVKTVNDLHAVLTRVFGVNIVGSDSKRVGQICRRVGKLFRRPGRPRKTTSRLP